jgi:CheY-like chemotaxis protein
MVVDDSPVDRRLAGSLLEQQGCSVRYASDGKEALQQISGLMPDLVLADLQMPEMNGLELVAAVKQDFPFIPVILMTAQGSEDIAAQALRVGAASYVPKRRLAKDLLPTVRRVLLGAHEDQGHSRLMHYLEDCDVTFVLPSDLNLLKILVNHVQEMLRCLPLGDETERMRVGLALEEALSNALYHGNLEIPHSKDDSAPDAYEQLVNQRLGESPYHDRAIRVSVRLSREQAVFVVRDEGPGFDVSKSPLVAAIPDSELGAGRGIVLMRATMDEVTYNSVGNEVTLIKRCVGESNSREPAQRDEL